MQVKWIVKTERDHARYARFGDGFKAVAHGVQSIIGGVGEICRY